MKLSEVVYQAVKNVKYLDDYSFTRESFVRGDNDSDPDYANTINNVFAPLNEAIHTLITLNKIKYKVATIKVSQNDNGLVDLTSLLGDIGEIINVGYLSGEKLVKIDYTQFGQDKIILPRRYSSNLKEIIVEYQEDIRTFSRDDIAYNMVDETSQDIDLTKEYGITNVMCSYIIEYVQGKLGLILDGNEGQAHINHAERNMNNLENAQSIFRQTHIKVVHSV